MIPKSKIKITDDIKIRNEIFELLSTTDQKKSSRWALNSAIHILNEVQKNNETIKNSIKILSLWQQDQKTTAEVRQAAFAIHKLARESQNETETSSLRALGHAIASGHTKAHAIIASDYAIQFINKTKNHNPQEVTKERTWQHTQLQKQCQFDEN